VTASQWCRATGGGEISWLVRVRRSQATTPIASAPPIYIRPRCRKATNNPDLDSVVKDPMGFQRGNDSAAGEGPQWVESRPSFAVIWDQI
jgi:hypothetical protein